MSELKRFYISYDGELMYEGDPRAPSGEFWLVLADEAEARIKELTAEIESLRVDEQDLPTEAVLQARIKELTEALEQAIRLLKLWAVSPGDAFWGSGLYKGILDWLAKIERSE